MASQGYYDWLNAGKPYALIRPARALVTVIGGYGITVYHFPNQAHLTANTPEDHTPFSVTGWPVPQGKTVATANRRWLARGVDIMPRSGSYVHRAENAAIARQLIADRNAGDPGVMWIKYINWTDENGVCRQERWTPDHTTRSSSDSGHIHVSGRSDVDTDPRADGYDPIARMSSTGGDMALTDLLKTGPKAGTTVDNALSFSWNAANLAADRAAATLAAVTALRSVVDALALAVTAGGGSVDTAAILAGVDERLATLAAETRDAVADLGEGGAAQVRADA